MNNPSEITGRLISLVGRTWTKFGFLVLPLLFFAVMFLFFPFREQFEFDEDEGYVAMRALLFLRGHSLYTEIWSDQPPLFTYILAGWIRIFGADINTARTLVLLFSSALVAMVAYFLRTTRGVLHAFMGIFLIFLLPYYTTLSVSLMVAVPIVAFAMLSLLALLKWHNHHQERWLILSAAALGFAVLTKLIIVFLAPIFVIGILIDNRARLEKLVTWGSLLRPALLWSLAFATIVFGLGIILVGPSNLNQLLGIHLAASQNQGYLDRIYRNSIYTYLVDSWPILFLAIIGCHFVTHERRWIIYYVSAWAASAFMMLSFYEPIWYHYQLLITVPAAILAGIALGESLRLVPQILHVRSFMKRESILLFATMIGLVYTLSMRLPTTLPDFDRPPVFITKGSHAPWIEQEFLTKMANHAPQTRWVVTTLTTYAFRVGLPVPPILAVPSGKRIANGELSEQQIIQVVDEYQPEQVLLREGEFPLLETHLHEKYRLLLADRKKLLYLRKDLKGQ